MVVMRLMGKRQIGQLQPFELAIAIMISELAAVPMQDTGIPLVNGIIPILTLLFSQVLISLISLKSVKARAVICGRPRILIEKGKILESNLVQELYTINDLLEQLRIANIPNIADVDYAILETNGQLSVIPKGKKRPLTPEDMQISVANDGLPVDLIIDGRFIDTNMQAAGVEYTWLKNELKKLGVTDINDVLLVSIDSDKKIFCQSKERGRH
jgi:uncharacterized membrane protein YcaP (DUF421 family)